MVQSFFMKRILLSILIITWLTNVSAQQKHVFSFSKSKFLLDGKLFQIIGGELHPSRIPKEYWKHRIQMAKAMGCNTISMYVFWNYHEEEEGKFDFKTGNKDLAAFIRLCQQEGMWVLFRPGPYVCGEWDFGGLPPYLLKYPDIKIRGMDKRFMEATSRYIKNISSEIISMQCTNGGPILMIQLENEYGSYGNDSEYLKELKKLWMDNGISIPFYTADGPAAHHLEAGALDGCAIGLDPGANENDFKTAELHNQNVPSFCSELYPGWLTHWGEQWQMPDTTNLLRDVRYLLKNKKSFSFYILHGGTNFGFTAGANAFAPTQYQPDVTSYDYNAPIDEQGNHTYKYFALRKLISQHVNYNLPDVPEPIQSAEIKSFKLMPFASIWSNLPEPIKTVQPHPMENFGQRCGFILYRTKLIGPRNCTLTITEPHDYALVFLNGVYVDSIYRDGGKWSIDLPKVDSKEIVLDILVEAMGRINFAQYMIDRKGITDRVTLNGITLMNWETFLLPMNENYIFNLKPQPEFKPTNSFNENKRGEGVFFKSEFDLSKPADTFLDMTNFKKGIVWVNGNNLGRYWNRGPQQRLYCPASFLKNGKNNVVVFDLHQQQATEIAGKKTLE